MAILKRIFIAFIAVLFSGTLTAQSKRPNIILIVADDLGYGEIGCYGQQKIETPHIDSLAKGGIRFFQFYAGTTVCAPSRASLMTGLHSGHTPVRGNKSFKPEGQAPLPDSIVTFANILQKAGYATGTFGKWGMGYVSTSGAPHKKGFDIFYGYNCQSLAHDYYPDHLWNNEKKIELPGNLTRDSAYSADLIHEKAIDFIKSSTTAFFAFLPYTLPHGDVIAPHDYVYNYYIKKFNEKPLQERPANYTNLKRTFEPYPHAAFASMVSRLDNYVGEIVEALRQKGELENTLILFTSDNGPHKENGGDPVFFQSTGGYKGIKRDLFEGGIRVPMIAYWKGKISPEVSRQPAAFWDIYPTFLEVAGIPSKKNIDGISFLPTLLKNKPQKQHDYYYWEFHEQNGKQALRWKNWKGIKFNVSIDPNSPLELYNLSEDPGEHINVADKYPDIVKQMNQFIKEAHTGNPDWPLLPGERH
jgi:arylsulfatase A-like enzyme